MNDFTLFSQLLLFVSEASSHIITEGPDDVKTVCVIISKRGRKSRITELLWIK